MTKRKRAARCGYSLVPRLPKVTSLGARQKPGVEWELQSLLAKGTVNRILLLSPRAAQ